MPQGRGKDQLQAPHEEHPWLGKTLRGQQEAMSILQQRKKKHKPNETHESLQEKA